MEFDSFYFHTINFRTPCLHHVHGSDVSVYIMLTTVMFSVYIMLMAAMSVLHNAQGGDVSVKHNARFGDVSVYIMPIAVMSVFISCSWQ